MPVIDIYDDMDISSKLNLPADKIAYHLKSARKKLAALIPLRSENPTVCHEQIHHS
jgi:hypothetical protein